MSFAVFPKACVNLPQVQVLLQSVGHNNENRSAQGWPSVSIWFIQYYFTTFQPVCGYQKSAIFQMAMG